MSKWDNFETRELETIWSALNAFLYRYNDTVTRQDLKAAIGNELEKRFRAETND